MDRGWLSIWVIQVSANWSIHSRSLVQVCGRPYLFLGDLVVDSGGQRPLGDGGEKEGGTGVPETSLADIQVSGVSSCALVSRVVSPRDVEGAMEVQTPALQGRHIRVKL